MARPQCVTHPFVLFLFLCTPKNKTKTSEVFLYTQLNPLLGFTRIIRPLLSSTSHRPLTREIGDGTSFCTKSKCKIQFRSLVKKFNRCYWIRALSGSNWLNSPRFLTARLYGWRSYCCIDKTSIHASTEVNWSHASSPCYTCKGKKFMVHWLEIDKWLTLASPWHHIYGTQRLCCPLAMGQSTWMKCIWICAF
jgi:hypothetical protein